MARRRRTASCQRCGRRFQLCRYNAHHQKFCSHADCKAERKRERQRASYQKRYAADEAFRRGEQQRCRDALAARRSHSSAPGGPFPASVSVDVELVTRGLLAQLIDSDDPEDVLTAARAYERRGQLLTTLAGSPRASPP